MVMEMDDGKQKSPYRGVWLVCLILILFPLVSCLITKWAIFTYQAELPYQTNMLSVKTIGCGVGLLFHLSCIIVGILNKPFNAVIYRVAEFFINLKITAKLAFSLYWNSVRDDGVVFWLYMAIIGTNFGIFLDSFLKICQLLF